MREHTLAVRDLPDGESAGRRRQPSFALSPGFIGVMTPAERNDHGREDNGRV